MWRILSILMLFCTALNASEVTVDTNLSVGKREDRLSWSIAGPHHKPNVLSELSFKHIKIKTIKLSILAQYENAFASLSGTWGDITSGRATDSDYIDNNRKFEISRSISKITGSYIAEGSALLGYRFSPYKNFKIAPIAGYANMQERLRLRHTVQKRAFNPFTNTVHKLSYHIKHVNSTYKARWDGPFAGAQFEQSIIDWLSLHGEYQFLFLLKYHGSGL